VSTVGSGGRIMLMTTSRSSYEAQIWDPNDDDGRIHLQGFPDSRISEAVERYFRHFKIKADLTFDSIEQFRNPLYLRIFCEAINHERQIEKEVFVGRQYILGMFETFLDRRNESFSTRINKPTSSRLLQGLLRKFARQLWQNNARHLTFEETVRLLDGKSPDDSDFNWHGSLTKALLNEELLINRDHYGGGQTVAFTYDMLGGYLIADQLLSDISDSAAAIALSTNTNFRPNEGSAKVAIAWHLLLCAAHLSPIMAG
jgi:hypothetical protein